MTFRFSQALQWALLATTSVHSAQQAVCVSSPDLPLPPNASTISELEPTLAFSAGRLFTGRSGALLAYERPLGVWQSPIKMGAPGFPGKRFNLAIAVDSHTVVASASSEAPSTPLVYAWLLDELGEITPGYVVSTAIGSAQGLALCIDGDLLFVSGVGEGGSLTGYVDVYDRQATGEWSGPPIARIDAPIQDPTARFGEALACASDQLVVGAPGLDKVYIYSATPGGPTPFVLASELSPPPGSDGPADFGVALAADEHFLVIGAPGRFSVSGIPPSFPGRVFVTPADAPGSLVELSNPTPQPADEYGFSVDIRGERLVVGSPGYRDVNLSGGLEPNIGALHLFEADPDSQASPWSLFSTLASPAIPLSGPGSTPISAEAGSAVLLGDDFLLAGTRLADHTLQFGFTEPETDRAWLSTSYFKTGISISQVETDKALPDVRFLLATCPPLAHTAFVVLGSLTGPNPTTVAGIPIPLEFDLFTVLTILSPNAFLAQPGQGVTDSLGRSELIIRIPAGIGLGPSAIGLSVYHSAVLLGSGTQQPILTASNAFQLCVDQ